MGNCRLIHVAYIIQFMAIVPLIFPSFAARPGMQRCSADSTGSVKIAIRFLRRTNQMNQAVHISIQCLILLDSHQIGGSFHDFIHIGVVKGIRRIELAFHQSRGNGKVIYTMRILTLPESKRNCNATNSLDTWRPEIISKMHIGERYIFIKIIGLFLHRAARGQCTKG